MPTITTVQPLIEPITLQEAKDHLNITDDMDDSIIEFIIQSAREAVENMTGRTLINRTYEHSRTTLDNEICLPYPMLQNVSNIAYIDTDGAAQTLATSLYEVDTKRTPGRVVKAYGQAYPSVRDKINAVTITYVAGYGANAQDVPSPLRSAMLLLIGLWYENRESVIIGTISSELPMGVKFLIAPYIIYSF